MVWSVDYAPRLRSSRGLVAAGARPALSTRLAMSRRCAAPLPLPLVKHFRPKGQDFLKCETLWDVCRNP